MEKSRQVQEYIDCINSIYVYGRISPCLSSNWEDLALICLSMKGEIMLEK